MRFIDGGPTFAAEVRSESDYKPGADVDMAEKRADYFLAGTEVVWDVDTVAECIHVIALQIQIIQSVSQRRSGRSGAGGSPAGAWRWTGFSPNRRA